MPTIHGDKVTCGTATFNEVVSTPAGAVIWRMDGLTGWDATGDLEVISSPRGGHIDGAIAGGFFPAFPRLIYATGYVMATSRAEADTLVDILWRDAFPRNADLVLTRYEPVPKFLHCRVSGSREIFPVGPQMFRWIAPLTAFDPLKYGVTVVTSGLVGVAGLATSGFPAPLTAPLTPTAIDGGGNTNVVNLFNAGTAATKPIATLYGPLAKGGWRLSNDTTDQFIRFDVELGISDVLVIDFAAEEALLNGFPVTATVTGDFWSVQPGVNVIKLYANYDVDAGFEISINSAWE